MNEKFEQRLLTSLSRSDFLEEFSNIGNLKFPRLYLEGGVG